jgi:hypothetical protein
LSLAIPNDKIVMCRGARLNENLKFANVDTIPMVSCCYSVKYDDIAEDSRRLIVCSKKAYLFSYVILTKASLSLRGVHV